MMKPFKYLIFSLIAVAVILLPGNYQLFAGNVSNEREVSLEEAFSLALEHNRELKISFQHQLAARSARKASFTMFLPSFDFSSQYLRMNKPFNLLSKDMFLPVIPYSAINPETGNLKPLELLQADPPVLVFGNDGVPLRDSDGNFVFANYAYIPQSAAEFGQKDNLLMNFSLMQPIYTGGKIKAQYAVSRHMEQMAVYGQKLTESEILYQVESFFWQLFTVQEKKELADQYIQMLQSLVADMENYLDEGMVNKNDLLRAKVALNEAEMEKLKAENGIQQLSMGLCRLMGLPLSQRLRAKEELQLETTEMILEDLWKKGLDQRPELKLAAEKAGLAHSMAQLAKAGQYPNIAFGASWIAANPNPYSGLEKEFGHDWVLGLTLTMPVYHWGERRQMHQAAIHEKNIQQLKLEDAYELVRLDITSTYFEFTEAQKNVEIKQLSLQQTNENLSMAKDQFEVGALKTTEMLEAQTMWHQAHTDFIESKSELREKMAALEKAIGD